jgi:hypothetical protein
VLAFLAVAAVAKVSSDGLDPSKTVDCFFEAAKPPQFTPGLQLDFG